MLLDTSIIPCRHRESDHERPQTFRQEELSTGYPEAPARQPATAPHENAKEFTQLFDSLEVYGKPQSTRDYMAVYQSTVLTWDVLRYQQIRC
jgi:hypothetical protein